eukprot:498842-Pleurochrysis_carterae.AAC.2
MADPREVVKRLRCASVDFVPTETILSLRSDGRAKSIVRAHDGAHHTRARARAQPHVCASTRTSHARAHTRTHARTRARVHAHARAYAHAQLASVCDRARA